MKGLSIVSLAISFAFIFLSAGVSAAFDFQVSPSIVSVCPCSSVTPQQVQVSVKNLHQYPDTFSFVAEVPPGFTSQVQSGLVINPGDTRSLDLFLINAGCSVQPGNYKATVRAKSGTTGDTQAKTLDMDVLNCYEVSLGIASKFREVCKEESKSALFDIVIENKGKYADTYSLTASVPWASFSDNSVTVEAGKKTNVGFALTPPESATGVYTVNIEVASQRFYSRDSDTVQISVQDCYSMSADLQPNEARVCLGEAVSQKLVITNLGIRNDTYSILLPNWVAADRSAVSLGPKSSAEISLGLRPSQKGRTFFNVTVASAGDPRSSRTLPAIVEADECRGVAVIASPSRSYVCAGVPAEFTILVKNLGTIQDTFNLTSTAGALDATKVTLSPGETKEMKLRVSNVTSGTYSIKVRAQADGVTDESIVEAIVESCYSASAEIAPPGSSVCFSSPVNYTIVAKNTGKLADSYILILESRFANATRQFSLSPGQARTEYFTVQVPADPQPGDQPVRVTLRSEHGASAGAQAMLTVKPRSSCYSVQVAPRDDTKLVQICNATAMPVMIRNTGEKRDRFAVSVAGPQWAYVSPNSVELSGGQEQEVYIYFSPCFGVEKKVYEITVKAGSQFSQAQKQIAVGVVENLTAAAPPGGGTMPPFNWTNMANASGGGNITGLILGLDQNGWKIVAIVIITIVIILILAIRFILLAKK